MDSFSGATAPGPAVRPFFELNATPPSTKCEVDVEYALLKQLSTTKKNTERTQNSDVMLGEDCNTCKNESSTKGLRFGVSNDSSLEIAP